MTAVAETCNTFRAYGDIYDNFQSIFSIVNYYADDPDNFSRVAGPGNFNDADMVRISKPDLKCNMCVNYISINVLVQTVGSW